MAQKHKKKLMGPLLMVLCTLFLAASQLLMKIATQKFTLSFEGIVLNWPFISGLVLAGLAAVIMTVAFKHGDMSSLFPLIALSFVWTTLIAAFVFAEVITLPIIAGIMLIIIGVVVLGANT